MADHKSGPWLIEIEAAAGTASRALAQAGDGSLFWTASDSAALGFATRGAAERFAGAHVAGAVSVARRW